MQKAAEVEMPQTLWAPTEPTSGLAAPVPGIPPVGIKKRQSSTKPEKGIPGTEKDEEEEEKKEEVQIRRNTEGTDRVQQQFIVQPSRKIRQGNHQERARKGIGNEHRLGDKLRHIRERGVVTNKRHRLRDSLHHTNTFGSGQGH